MKEFLFKTGLYRATLLSYERKPQSISKEYNPYFNEFSLTVEKRYLFGLFKITKKINYDYVAKENSGNYTSHWDDLIKNKIGI
ncbi:MAG: hypothetical protein LBE36_13480 [Flavobacteriaceae bacterium]|jgi:hypothetical protein|nr:hypothetical protein [Flavobacteriaceae bacterium]